MTREELSKALKCISDKMDRIEHQLPYESSQLLADDMFKATIRQRLYSVRCNLGSLRMTVNDDRNWTSGK